MHGKVKWFSAEKGYGFIVGDDGVERHFAVRDVSGADLPSNGDGVSFEHQDAKKGPRATGVRIEQRVSWSAAARDDNRVTCTHCGKKMVPRIITYRGSLSRSVCPFCGGVYKQFGWCFIASAVYEPDAPQLAALRRIRDSDLRPWLAGRLFIAVYYYVSPPVARALRHSPVASALVRRLLDVVARFDGG